MKWTAKALLVCGLLLYAVSMFLPWFAPLHLGCNTTYWSFKAEYYCTTNPPLYGEAIFLDYWSSYSIGTAFFVSQILTFLVGFLTLLKKVKRKYELMLLGLTLFFLTIPIGVIILHSYVLFDYHGSQLRFLSGFSIATVAFLLLTASLLTSLIRNIYPSS